MNPRLLVTTLVCSFAAGGCSSSDSSSGGDPAVDSDVPATDSGSASDTRGSETATADGGLDAPSKGDAPGDTVADATDAGTDGATSDAPGDADAGSGAVTRPTYNTGKGFFVRDGKLYDPKGVEFRIRGVNKLHWDADSPGLPKTHANTERWVMDFKQPTATNLALMKKTVDAKIVPMPGNWDGTCKEDTATLNGIVDTWVAQASAWKTYDASMILNIANEWGPSGVVWRDTYIAAIKRLRDAGYLATISITSGGCGQDNDDLVNYAKAVFDSDPQKNVIFDQHIYGNWANGGGATWQIDLKTALDKLKALNLPIIVGEFGPGRDIGPSPTKITPTDVMKECEARNIGWMAWAWDDPASGADDAWFALSHEGKYDSSADLTIFGKAVVEDATYGLLKLAKPATGI